MVNFFFIYVRLACDMKVVRLMRERGLGNSSTRLQNQLLEQHSERWLHQPEIYLSECQSFAKHLATAANFRDPPPFPSMPQYKWLLAIYTSDVMSRTDDVKAAITSTYGGILKMDSTKKVCFYLTYTFCNLSYTILCIPVNLMILYFSDT